MTTDTIIAIAVLVALVSIDFISSMVFARTVRKHFETHRSKMLQDISAQANRVDGLVRQYRLLVKQTKSADTLTKRMDELESHVFSELAERIEEIDMSVMAVLEGDEDLDEYEEPAPIVQPVAAKPQNGLAAVDAAAKSKTNLTGNQYSKYQELRDQGFTATEATAILRGQQNGKGGKRNGK